MRLLAVVEYDGTNFAGFQLQARRDPPPRTVQDELERAIHACAGEATRVIGSGRTDAGVHARGQVVHFDLSSRLARDPRRLRLAVNAHLPEDVKVHAVRRVAESFHARYSARSRTYCYRVLAGGSPSPLLRHHAHHVRARLAPERMQEGATHLLGAHDFACFAAREGPGSTRREVLSARVVEVGHAWGVLGPIWHTSGAGPVPASVATSDDAVGPARLVEIEVRATGFLRHMMRRIAGTLIRVGDGRLEPADVARILASGDKALAGPTAPARGLCLEHVEYDAAVVNGAGEGEALTVVQEEHA